MADESMDSPPTQEAPLTESVIHQPFDDQAVSALLDGEGILGMQDVDVSPDVQATADAPTVEEKPSASIDSLIKEVGELRSDVNKRVEHEEDRRKNTQANYHRMEADLTAERDSNVQMRAQFQQYMQQQQAAGQQAAPTAPEDPSELIEDPAKLLKYIDDQLNFRQQQVINRYDPFAYQYAADRQTVIEPIRTDRIRNAYNSASSMAEARGLNDFAEYLPEVKRRFQQATTGDAKASEGNDQAIYAVYRSLRDADDRPLPTVSKPPVDSSAPVQAAPSKPKAAQASAADARLARLLGVEESSIQGHLQSVAASKSQGGI